MIPDNPDALLTRDAVAVALTLAGYPISGATLATMVTRGGGPEYSRFGSRPLYRWCDALEWAKARVKEPVEKKSEDRKRSAKIRLAIRKNQGRISRNPNVTLPSLKSLEH